MCISFIHLEVCLTTGPKPLPKRSLHKCDLELPPSNGVHLVGKEKLFSARNFELFLTPLFVVLTEGNEMSVCVLCKILRAFSKDIANI